MDLITLLHSSKYVLRKYLMYFYSALNNSEYFSGGCCFESKLKNFRIEFFLFEEFSQNKAITVNIYNTNNVDIAK